MRNRDLLLFTRKSLDKSTLDSIISFFSLLRIEEMKMLFGYALALSWLLAAVGATPNGPIVNTTSGSYIGASDTTNAVDIFFGIRFASPPSRFILAAPIVNPPNVLQSALAFGADCPQFPGTSILPVAGVPAGPPLRGPNQSEDCLFLNVGALALTGASRLLFKF